MCGLGPAESYTALLRSTASAQQRPYGRGWGSPLAREKAFPESWRRFSHAVKPVRDSADSGKLCHISHYCKPFAYSLHSC